MELNQNSNKEVMKGVLKEEFNRLTKLSKFYFENRKDNFNMHKKRKSTQHVFSNLIKCSECGYSFRRCKRNYAPDKPIYIWWTCSHRNAYGANSCKNKVIIHEDELLNIILEYLNSLFKDKEKTIELISKRVKNIIEEENKEIKNNVKNIQNEYDNLNNSKKNRMLMFDKGIITIDELHEEINEITNKQNKLQLSLDRIKIDNINVESIITNYFKKLNFILNKEDITNKMLKDIISSIVISPENEIKIYLKIANKSCEDVEISLNKIIPNTDIGTYRGNKMEWFSKLFLQFI